jgi:integrase
VKGKPYFCEPKSKRSRRRLSLSQMALDALRAHMKQRLIDGHAGAETVFYNADGGLLTKSNFRNRVWLPLLKKADVPVKRFHDMRHTNISLMLKDGENILTTSRRAGHSSIAITMDTYGHLLEGEDRSATERMGGLLDVCREVDADSSEVKSA